MRRIHLTRSSVFATLLSTALLAGSCVAGCGGPPHTIALRGTVVTPQAVLRPGWVVIEGDRITRVSDEPPTPSTATVDTGGLIFPGLIDLHNHIAWNAVPRWSPQGRYVNRYHWRDSQEYQRTVAAPAGRLHSGHACDAARYGELRAMTGGVTTIVGSFSNACAGGLIRNLDAPPAFPGTADPVELAVAVIDPDSLSADRRREIASRLTEGSLRRLYVHLAEGRSGDPRSRDEFLALVRDGLLGPQTVIVHGTALGQTELDIVKASGASLVWSPRSNMELYGETTAIAGVLDRGIDVALAPDWSVTGSNTLLDELRYAAAYSAAHLRGRLTARMLIDMVTEAPARIAGIADRIGAIRPGLMADLVVIAGDGSKPYDAFLAARPRDVRLVVVGGKAVYGIVPLMNAAGKTGDWEEIRVCGETKAVDITAGGRWSLDTQERFGRLHERLRAAMSEAAPGGMLAPVVECS